MIVASTKRNSLILSGFAVAVTVLITLTFLGTKDVIRAQEQAKLLSVISDVVPQASYNNDIQHNCVALPSVEALGNTPNLKAYRGLLDGQMHAIAIESVAPNGYSGAIRFIIGLSGEDFTTVTGVRVLQHMETPGLGDKIDERISPWIYDFTGQAITPELRDLWQVKRDGGQFDAFTGATITPRALVNAVANTALYIQQNREQLSRATNLCDTGATS
jgi:electron transport complex protein RnfG